MNITLFVTPDCHTCKRVENRLSHLLTSTKGVNLTIKNISEAEKNLLVVPAIFINEKLYSYGEMEEKKLLEVFKAKNL